MPFSLVRIGQIALAARDVDRAEAFYESTLGMRKLYRFGDLTFFDCSGVRLLLEKAHHPDTAHHGSPIYFTCHDIALAVRELEARGVSFARRLISLPKWMITTSGWRSSTTLMVMSLR